MHNPKDEEHFKQALALQDQGERQVFIISVDGAAAGYTMLSWSPKYPLYRSLGIPEIQDLNIVPDYRRRGLAGGLIAHCEGLVRGRGFEHIGIGVGLDASYGAAQRLYVQMGYVPDGNGVTYDRVNVRFGEMRPIDDDLSLMMVKGL
ncbi:MAG: GNAT family N-acetyltransferase [Micavibrio sp.]|nr:GNAT family N-acetyltransferase [Micavibrio sp.]